MQVVYDSDDHGIDYVHGNYDDDEDHCEVLIVDSAEGGTVFSCKRAMSGNVSRSPKGGFSKVRSHNRKCAIRP